MLTSIEKHKWTVTFNASSFIVNENTAIKNILPKENYYSSGVLKKAIQDRIVIFKRNTISLGHLLLAMYDLLKILNRYFSLFYNYQNIFI